MSILQDLYIDNKRDIDIIIQNPPYNGSLHIDFLKKSMSIANRIISIQPATFLINIRDNGKSKSLYTDLKNELEGHVVRCEINNFNKEFMTDLHVPFVILSIDMTKEYSEIDYECSNERCGVRSIFDCNRLGDYSTIKSIVNKCLRYGDMMKNHTTTSDIDDPDIKYMKFMSIITKHDYDSEPDKVKTRFGTYYGTFTTPLIHKDDHTIYDSVPLTRNGNPSSCVYGTEDELRNWEYYVYNNKLPIFINIVMTIDQNNNSRNYVPWFTDKRYSDDEIYSILGLTNEERELIDDVLTKFEWHNEYYRRLSDEYRQYEYRKLPKKALSGFIERVVSAFHDTDDRIARRGTVSYNRHAQRASKTQEFFTPYSIIRKMCLNIPEMEWRDPNKTFLDPCAGNGNIILCILYKRIHDCGVDWITALSTTFAIELMEDNVTEMRERVHLMLESITLAYDRELADRIMDRNFITGDFLKDNIDFS